MIFFLLNFCSSHCSKMKMNRKKTKPQFFCDSFSFSNNVLCVERLPHLAAWSFKVRNYLCCGKAICAKLVEYERIEDPHVACGRHLLHSSKISLLFCGHHCCCCVTDLDHKTWCGTLWNKVRLKLEYHISKYRTCATITLSWLETALEY